MKNWMFRSFAILLFVPLIAFSQIKISGKIISKNKPVSKVNITLKDTYDGATSDENGNYSFETTEKGTHILVFIHPDFAEIGRPVNLENSPIVLNVELKAQINEISAVVITAGSIEAGDKKRATAALTPMDIYQTAGGNGQMTEGYKFLPGVQKAGESEGLFVRGGTGTETKFYIDGNLVNNYFTASVPGIPGHDRFNTNLFKGSSFSSGGYSAIYGQALSAILSLDSVDFPDKNSAGFSVFPFSLTGDFQKVNVEKTFSYGLETNYFNLGLITKLLNFNTDFIKAPVSFGINGNFRKKFKNDGVLKYYGSFDTNLLKVSQPSLELNYDTQEPAVKGQNIFQSLSYRQKIGKYILSSGLSFSYDKKDISVGIVSSGNEIGEVLINSAGTYFNQKTVVERKLKNASNVKFGYEFNCSDDEFDNKIFNSNNQHSTFKNLNSAFFTEANLAFTKNLSVSGGLRAENSSFLNKWNIAPRLAAAYRISPTWITSFAYGKFYQNPDAQFLIKDLAQPFQEATHYIFQVEHSANKRTLRGEIFYKDYRNLEKSITQNFMNAPSALTGKGFANGAEILWSDRQSFDNFKYRISYSFLDSKRDYLNYPQELFPSFASNHNLSIVASKDIPNIKSGISVSYAYASPRPYYNIIQKNGENFLLSEGKTKDYNVLNLSGYYLPNLGKKDAKSFTILVAGINNVLGFKNIHGYRFSQDGLRSAAVVPSANIMFYVGAIFNFGIDKTQDTIDKL